VQWVWYTCEDKQTSEENGSKGRSWLKENKARAFEIGEWVILFLLYMCVYTVHSCGPSFCLIANCVSIRFTSRANLFSNCAWHRGKSIIITTQNPDQILTSTPMWSLMRWTRQNHIPTLCLQLAGVKIKLNRYIFEYCPMLVEGEVLRKVQTNYISAVAEWHFWY